jgi:hypothetical protein
VLAGVPADIAAIEPIEPVDGFALDTVQLAVASGRPAQSCRAATPDAWLAYAILTGTTPAALAGSVILIDPSGWLRSVIRNDGETGIDSLVLPLLAEIVRHPISAPPGDAHVHH